MADFTRYVNTESTPGGTGTTSATTGTDRAFASLNEAEASCQLLGTDGDNVFIYCAGAAADTTAVLFDGWVTGVRVVVEGDLETGVYDSSKYEILSASTGAVLEIRIPYKLHRLQVSAPGIGNYPNTYAIANYSITTDSKEIDRCLVRCTWTDTGVATQDDLILVVGGSPRITNTVAVGVRGSGGGGIDAGITSKYATLTTIINCTSYGSAKGFERQSGAVECINCAGFNNTTDFSGTITQSYNASSDATATGTGSQTNLTDTDEFEDPSNGDFNLLSSSDLVDTGDDSTGVLLDIAGATRDASPDIGAFEYVAAGGDSEINAEPGSYSVTGVAANTSLHQIFNAEPSSYTITGVDAELAFVAGLVDSEINAEPGGYLVTGVGASVGTGRQLSCDTGSYSVSGVDATLSYKAALELELGSYTVSGVAAELDHTVDRFLNAETGLYSVSGVDVDFTHLQIFNAEPSIYAITGVDANLLFDAAESLDAEPGSYNIVGSDMDMDLGLFINNEPGTYILSGVDIGTTIDYSEGLDTGSYNVSGVDTTLSLSQISIDTETGSYSLSGVDTDLVEKIRRIHIGPWSTFSIT